MEISLNLLLLGDTCVGKTQILNHYIKKEYIKITGSGPLGLDYKKKTIEINEKKLHLKIWDHAGQRRFFSFDNFHKKFMKNQDIFILIYDITNRYSFEYKEYNIIIFSEDYLKINQLDTSISFLYYDKQEINIDDKNNEYTLSFKKGIYNKEHLVLYKE
jgi:GTPase SAR1 family protein